jgi:DNA-3-methyladenine glycosylase I
MLTRCDWAGTDPLYVAYHDEEWGVPVHDDRTLFEFLVLEGAQAGLSWITVLRKREAYRDAFDNFDPEKVACYDEQKVARLLENKGIIRNRRKIESAIRNARHFLEVQQKYGSFDSYIWDFVDGKPIQNSRSSVAELPPFTPLGEKISKDLKKKGFNFVGPTIVYSFMQAVGMVNDHIVTCFRHAQLGRSARDH